MGGGGGRACREGGRAGSRTVRRNDRHSVPIKLLETYTRKDLELDSIVLSEGLMIHQSQYNS
jgi:hypothetical protein